MTAAATAAPSPCPPDRGAMIRAQLMLKPFRSCEALDPRAYACIDLSQVLGQFTTLTVEGMRG
jgi:hypothetical protein